MGRRPASTSTAFSRRVVRAIEQLRDQRRLSNTELIRAAEFSANYFYIRLRGEAPFNTNDIEKLANALNVEPYELLRLAQSDDLVADDESDWTERLDGPELARRLTFLAAAPTSSDARAFNVDELVAYVQDRSLDFTAETWTSLLTQAGTIRLGLRLLDAVAEYFDVEPPYLRSTRDAELAERVEAEVDLDRALMETGATSVSARALGGTSVKQLQAIARAIRSIETESREGGSSA